MKAAAKRIPVFVEPDVSEIQHCTSAECLLGVEQHKSVECSHRRRSSSLDNENGKQRNRKALAEKMHIERKVGYWAGLNDDCMKFSALSATQ